MFVTFLEMKIIHLHDYNKLKHVKVMFLVKKKHVTFFVQKHDT